MAFPAHWNRAMGVTHLEASTSQGLKPAYWASWTRHRPSPQPGPPSPCTTSDSLAARCCFRCHATPAPNSALSHVIPGPSSSPSSSSADLGDRGPPANASVIVNPVRDFGFPYEDRFWVDGQCLTGQQVMDLLNRFMSEERIQRIQEVAANRTYTVLPIVEGLYDMGNLAAVARSADALGFGSLHCINYNQDKYKKSQRSAAGSDKWLHVKAWGSAAQCIGAAKAAGYQVLATHLHASSVAVQQVDWTRPTAFIMGNEKQGVSAEAVALADGCVAIPMLGFVESFNISVAAALIMYEAQQQRLRRLGRQGDLGEEQQRVLRAVMTCRALKNSRGLMTELLTRPAPYWQARHFKHEAALLET